jgi:hypothetical protein
MATEQWEDVSKFLDKCEGAQKAWDDYSRNFAPGPRLRGAPVRPDNPIWHARTAVRRMLTKGVTVLFSGDTMLVDPSKLDAIQTAEFVGALRPDECGAAKHEGKTWIRLWWD